MNGRPKDNPSRSPSGPFSNLPVSFLLLSYKEGSEETRDTVKTVDDTEM